MIRKYKTSLILLFTLLIFLKGISYGQAQDMIVIKNLSFGTFGVLNNNAVHTITVTDDTNLTSYSTGIMGATAGQRGEYSFTGLAPNVTFFVGISVPNPPTEGGIMLENATYISNGGSPYFIVEDFTANNMATDAIGQGSLFIGATLKTTGLLGTYTSDTYSGTVDLTLYY